MEECWTGCCDYCARAVDGPLLAAPACADLSRCVPRPAILLTSSAADAPFLCHVSS